MNESVTKIFKQVSVLLVHKSCNSVRLLEISKITASQDICYIAKMSLTEFTIVAFQGVMLDCGGSKYELA